MLQVTLGSRQVGVGQPCFIVAEAGQNHNASLETALRLCDAAKFASCDAVKFQKRNPDICVPEGQKGEPKDTPWGRMTYLEYRWKLELTHEDFRAIHEHCQAIGIDWFSSVWDVDSLAFFENNLALPYYKLPSACLTDIALVGALADTGKPVILSTGMSNHQQIGQALLILAQKSAPVILNHCVSTYPCPVSELNLRCITTLQETYPDIVVGYSGHEVGLATTVVAVALGASYIERHITLDRSTWGTDHAASVEPNGLYRLVHDIRNVEKAMGDGQKRIMDSEREPMKRLRRVG